MIRSLLVVLVLMIMALPLPGCSSGNDTVPAAMISVNPLDARVQNLEDQSRGQTEQNKRYDGYENRIKALEKTPVAAPPTTPAATVQAFDPSGLQQQIDRQRADFENYKKSTDESLAKALTPDPGIDARLRSLEEVMQASGADIHSGMIVTYLRDTDYIFKLDEFTVSTASFVFKITNGTGVDATNIDIFGMIDSDHSLEPDYGYPAIADSNGVYAYSTYFDTSKTTTFESYQYKNGKSYLSVSLPAGKSITLRPVFSIKYIAGESESSKITLKLKITDVFYD